MNKLASNLEKEFFTFIYKRHLIWYKRFVLHEHAPWTTDHVLKTYKIINVYRELDKCTRYLLDTLNEVKDRKKLLLNVIFYRFFNTFNLYQDLEIVPFDKLDNTLNLKLQASFERIKRRGRPIFNNAYLISSGTKGQKKHLSILTNLQDLNLTEMISALDNARTPRDALEVLQTIPMVGPFLACEIWTDLSYLNFFTQRWTDNDFVNIGPGAKWGLEILYDSKLSKKEQEERLLHLHTIQKDYLETIHKRLNELHPWKEIAYKHAFSNYPFLSLTNIEGALCEFRKYWNITHGKGRRKYFHQITS